MASPLKLSINLGSKLVTSPRTSPKVLSPRIFSRNDSPPRNSNFTTGLDQLQRCSPRSNIVIEVSGVENEQLSKKSFLINTPNKLSLLKNGISKAPDSFNVLGQGTFGTVIQGQYKTEKVAVKVAKLESGDKLRESNVLGVCHANIVKVLEILVKEKEKYGLIVMEYHPGSLSLLSVLNNYDIILNKFRKLQFAIGITRGLECCHRNGILHLDLKPSNVLLCGSICKICDFGNSRQIAEVDQFYKFQGTVAYAAPEILAGRNPTSKSDVYSLGILFWQIRCRRSPYSMKNEEEVKKDIVIYKVVKFNYRPKFEIYEMDEFSDLSSTCWQQKPADRPETLQVLQILNNFLSNCVL